jgi:DNA-binding MarR family transcriptional regulator
LRAGPRRPATLERRERDLPKAIRVPKNPAVLPWPVVLQEVPNFRGLKSISYRINYIHRLLDRQTKKFLTDHYRLTNAEWYVLAFLAAMALGESDTIVGISRKTAIFKPQVSQAMNSLAKRQLVRRIVDSSDGRTPRFQVSKKGKELRNEIARWTWARQKALIGQLSPGQSQTIDEALNILATYMSLNV